MRAGPMSASSSVSPDAGKLPDPDGLVDVDRLFDAYYEL